MKKVTGPIDANQVHLFSDVVFVNKLLKRLCTVQDKPSGELVIVLEAEDSDTGPNGEVSYTLVQRQDNKDWQSFNLDADTGRLTTNRRLDREQQNEYQVERSHASLNLECSHWSRISGFMPVVLFSRLSDFVILHRYITYKPISLVCFLT